MITITFNPQTPEQVQILAWAMTKLLEASDAEPAVKEEAPAAKKPKAVKPTPTPAPEPTPTPAITLEEVRAKLVAYKEKGKPLKELFETVGCANLSAVPADRYAELLGNMDKS